LKKRRGTSFISGLAINVSATDERWDVVVVGLHDPSPAKVGAVAAALARKARRPADDGGPAARGPIAHRVVRLGQALARSLLERVAIRLRELAGGPAPYALEAERGQDDDEPEPRSATLGPRCSLHRGDPSTAFAADSRGSRHS
jgi:hypothetical protein